MKLKSFVQGKWIEGKGVQDEIYHSVTGEKVFEVSTDGLDFQQILEYGRNTGGKKLREMTFHQRAIMLKNLAKHLLEHKDQFYELAPIMGANKRDAWIDIEGGVATFFTYSGKGRRELPDSPYLVEGPFEPLSKEGTFVGQHICVPLEGVAVHINAYNFPCWGMLEKLAPTFLAGMPAIVKPASATAFLTEKMVRVMVDSKILPPGSLQLICGKTGDLFEHLTLQDVVTFTGSQKTGQMLRSHPNILKNNIRFNMEADSLNCTILGEDDGPETEEFKLFLKEILNEMKVKSGQKCTAIRRILVPRKFVGSVKKNLIEEIKKLKMGDPQLKEVKIGPLINKQQKENVEKVVQELEKECMNLTRIEESSLQLLGEVVADSFYPPTLLYCEKPLEASLVHDLEAFGPVATLMCYDSVDDLVKLGEKGQGSLVGSLFTKNNEFAKQVVLRLAAYHGRFLILNEESAKESTGHGSPLPHLVHGGPGRAGGGEEMGGIRAVKHYMQRSALQGSPTTLSHIGGQWIKGSNEITDIRHPFTKYFNELVVGETLRTHRRTVTEADIVQFAGISGDFFYAHVDAIAAKESLFEDRVAHGYFLISAAAGLFVHPAPGPVLANYGLENLRFIQPVYIGDTIQVRITVKEKIEKELKEDQKPQGVVVWDVEIFNQNQETVATYDILTLVERQV